MKAFFESLGLGPAAACGCTTRDTEPTTPRVYKRPPDRIMDGPTASCDCTTRDTEPITARGDQRPPRIPMDMIWQEVDPRCSALKDLQDQMVKLREEKDNLEMQNSRLKSKNHQLVRNAAQKESEEEWSQVDAVEEHYREIQRIRSAIESEELPPFKSQGHVSEGAYQPVNSRDQEKESAKIGQGDLDAQQACRMPRGGMFLLSPECTPLCTPRDIENLQEVKGSLEMRIRSLKSQNSQLVCALSQKESQEDWQRMGIIEEHYREIERVRSATGGTSDDDLPSLSKVRHSFKSQGHVSEDADHLVNPREQEEESAKIQRGGLGTLQALSMPKGGTFLLTPDCTPLCTPRDTLPCKVDNNGSWQRLPPLPRFAGNSPTLHLAT